MWFGVITAWRLIAAGHSSHNSLSARANPAFLQVIALLSLVIAFLHWWLLLWGVCWAIRRENFLSYPSSFCSHLGLLLPWQARRAFALHQQEALKAQGVCVAAFHFCWGRVGNARELNVFRSSADSTGLWGWGRQGREGAAGQPGDSSPRRRVVFAEGVALAGGGSESCSLCSALNRAPGKFGNLLSSTLTWTNITVV